MSNGSTDNQDADRGAATVEAAIALCSLLLVFGLVLGGISVVTGQLRCTDAAGAAARVLARGHWQRAGPLVAELAPAGARLEVRAQGRALTVTVTAEPFEGMLPGIDLHGEAYALLEPGVDAPPPSVGADHAAS